MTTPPYGQPYPYDPYQQRLPVPAVPVTSALAPYGFDPVSGQPFSDKSKIAAGLLQLLPGVLLGLGGIGRLYAGQVTLGVIQIVVTVVGWISFWCGFVLLFPFVVYFGCWLWFLIDGIVMLAGRPVDGDGRLLRA
jgi:TM2 domain-containing membrane protein YozV